MDVSQQSNSIASDFLQDREQFFNQVLQSMDEYAVFTTDKEGYITSWNTGAFYLFDYTTEEILNRQGNILYTPEDIASHIPEQEMETALNEGSALNERYHVKKDRTQFWGSGMVFPLFDKNNQHQGYTKIMRNLTWVKAIEEENREVNAFAKKLISTSLEPLVVLNNDLTVNNYSEPFKQFFQLQDEQYRGMHIYDVLDTKVNKSRLQHLFEDELGKHDFKKDFEIALNEGTESQKIIKIDTRKFTINDKGKQMIMQAFEDVTEKKALQEMKEIFIGVASHEIKNPLAVLRAYVQLLQKELGSSADEKVRIAVKKINEQGDKLLRLVNQLLDVSKLENFELKLKKEQFNIRDLIAKAVEEFKAMSPHDILFKTGLDVEVCADPIRIHQVLTNLISNAIKYSPGTTHIIIEMYIEERNRKVVVKVQDFGIGVREIDKEKLFDKFQRASDVEGRRIQGVGLGLHISKEIVESHEGELWFESEEGKGSSFYFSLPLVDACS
ncbi:PAS domain-containing sensor histidine kinase [Desertivirga brevis]|uniref:PAS domain-containing sensor histidine kinase n=1 Tax=Desertivirga brevis TaxID=2810310 RepID=UPI001A9713EB|nr:PAS domain-containing sensor histidine kinase [Pedobacter sp. SYSU D00873]